MPLLTPLAIARRALAQHKLRAGLAALGLAIAAGALIAVESVSFAIDLRVQREISKLGSDLIMVFPGSRQVAGVSVAGEARTRLTEGDVDAIRDEVADIDLVGAVWWSGGPAIRGNRNWVTRIHGVTPDYLDARNWDLLAGRMMTDEDIALGQRVAFLGATVADKLFPGEDPVGQTIRLRTAPYVVAGVFAPKGTAESGADYDDIVFVPLSAARSRLPNGRQTEVRPVIPGDPNARQTQVSVLDVQRPDRPAKAQYVARPGSPGSRAAEGARPAGAAEEAAPTIGAPKIVASAQIKPGLVDAIQLRVSDGAEIEVVREQVERLLRQRHGAGLFGGTAPFSVREVTGHLKAREEAAETLKLTFLFVAAVASLAGGIGIANVMLASVLQRRPEIAIRRAVGARARDIALQFLAEAMLIGCIGGVLGILFGAVSVVVLRASILPEASASLSGAAAAVAGAATVGLIAGLWPARRAASLDPADLLRRE